jgi:hypothetical protein
MTTATRINVVGIDSNDARWFWQKDSNSWNLYADLATNFPTVQIAESAAGRIRAGERLKDPEDRMDVIFVKEVT